MEEVELMARQAKQLKELDPDAWATKDMCVGPTLGNIRYGKLPIQSLNPLRYTHEKLYSEKTVIGLMKDAYYNGYTDRALTKETSNDLHGFL